MPKTPFSRNVGRSQPSRQQEAKAQAPEKESENPSSLETKQRYVVIHNSNNTGVINAYINLPADGYVKITKRTQKLMAEHCDTTGLNDVTESIDENIFERMEVDQPVNTNCIEEWLSEQG